MSDTARNVIGWTIVLPMAVLIATFCIAVTVFIVVKGYSLIKEIK